MENWKQQLLEELQKINPVYLDNLEETGSAERLNQYLTTKTAIRLFNAASGIRELIDTPTEETVLFASVSTETGFIFSYDNNNPRIFSIRFFNQDQKIFRVFVDIDPSTLIYPKMSAIWNGHNISIPDWIAEYFGSENECVKMFEDFMLKNFPSELTANISRYLQAEDDKESESWSKRCAVTSDILSSMPAPEYELNVFGQKMQVWGTGHYKQSCLEPWHLRLQDKKKMRY